MWHTLVRERCSLDVVEIGKRGWHGVSRPAWRAAVQASAQLGRVVIVSDYAGWAREMRGLVWGCQEKPRRIRSREGGMIARREDSGVEHAPGRSRKATRP